ncbi:hypothetical protein PEPS_46880 (plasmid) [Persicobacter psychrovividus]|uniref:Uncharacterized protein n=1 Tax=Persicobacter psychrovividus TaxID=387638 RepID=A0ABM7VN21_9BACT|nr:hypothetical protein PEPS_46880 [Persicobacter psychrovividus]
MVSTMVYTTGIIIKKNRAQRPIFTILGPWDTTEHQ